MDVEHPAFAGIDARLARALGDAPLPVVAAGGHALVRAIERACALARASQDAGLARSVADALRDARRFLGHGEIGVACWYVEQALVEVVDHAAFESEHVIRNTARATLAVWLAIDAYRSAQAAEKAARPTPASLPADR